MKFLRGSERVPERHLHRGEPWTAPRALTAASRAGRPWGHIFTVREENYVILNLDFYRAVAGDPTPPRADRQRTTRERGGPFCALLKGTGFFPHEKNTRAARNSRRDESFVSEAWALSPPRVDPAA